MDKIRAVFVFEIMGRPAEHIVTTLNMFIDKLAEIPAIKIEERNVHKPKLIEDENVQNLFTTFAEVELTADNLEVVFDIILQMLPAHVEILEPIEFRIQNFELSGMLSKLAIKLHKYDEIAKASIMDRNALMKRMEEMQAKINELELGKKPAKKKPAAKKKSKKGSKSKASEKHKKKAVKKKK